MTRSGSSRPVARLMTTLSDIGRSLGWGGGPQATARPARPHGAFASTSSRRARGASRTASLRARRDAELGVDALDVVARGLLGDRRPARDVAAGRAAGDEQQDLGSRAVSPPGGRARGRWPALAGGGEDVLAASASIRPPAPRRAAPRSRPRRRARAVRARLGQRVVDVRAARIRAAGRAPSPAASGGRRTRRGARGGRPRSPRARPATPAGRGPAPCSTGCSRTRSRSTAVSGPGLSQIVFGTPERPRSCTSPARRSCVTASSGEPRTLARRPPPAWRRRASGRRTRAT